MSALWGGHAVLSALRIAESAAGDHLKRNSAFDVRGTIRRHIIQDMRRVSRSASTNYQSSVRNRVRDTEDVFSNTPFYFAFKIGKARHIETVSLYNWIVDEINSDGTIRNY